MPIPIKNEMNVILAYWFIAEIPAYERGQHKYGKVKKRQRCLWDSLNSMREACKYENWDNIK